jgi:hypothetical protein
MTRRLDLFLDNAILAKDYRVLLRSPRVMVMGTLALTLLSLIAASLYSGMFEQGRSLNPTQAQSQLLQFYTSMTLVVNGVVVLLAPVLAASAVVGQTARMNLELAMVGPRQLGYLLLGTLMSVYRQVVLLLAATLPISAVGVMLGGVTWQTLFTNYFLMSLQGLLLAAIALNVGLRQKNLVATLMLTLGVTVMFVIMSSLFALIAGFSGGGSASSTNPFQGLIPFASVIQPGEAVPFFGMQVPHWIWCGLSAFLLARLLVSVSEAALTRAGSRENIIARAWVLVSLVLYLAYLQFGLGGAAAVATAAIPRGSNPISLLDIALGRQWPMLLIFTMTVYGFFESRKELVPVKSIFSREAARELLTARGEGTVVYALVLFALCMGATVAALSGIPGDDMASLAIAVYTAAFWLHMMSLAWMGSGMGRTSVTGRVIPWIAAALLVLAGNGLLATLQGWIEVVWNLRFDLLGFYPWNPAHEEPVVVIGKAAVLFVLAVLAYKYGERVRLRRIAEGMSPV